MFVDVFQLLALIVNDVKAEVLQPLQEWFGVFLSLISGAWGVLSTFFQSNLESYLWLGLAGLVTCVFIWLVVEMNTLRIHEMQQGREAVTWNQLKKVIQHDPRLLTNGRTAARRHMLTVITFTGARPDGACHGMGAEYC